MDSTRTPSARTGGELGLAVPLAAWQSWTLGVMLFLALFARDGRFQLATSAGALALLLVIASRRAQVARLSPGVLVALLAWAVASVAWSRFPADSVTQVINFGVWTAVGVGLASSGSTRAVGLVWVRMAYPTVLLALYSSIGYAAGGGRDGLFNSKNHVGFAAASCIIPIIAMHWSRHRLVVGAFVSMALTAAVLANSQTGVTLVVVIPLFFVAVHALSRTRFTALSAAGFVSAAAVGFMGVLFSQFLLGAFTGLLGRDSELSGRDGIWDAVIVGVRERPVLGTGIGGVWTRRTEEPTLSVLLDVPLNVREATGHAHNGLLDAALQLGLVGAALLLLVVLATLRRGLVRVLRGGDLTTGMPAVVAITYLIANSTETRLFNDQAWVLLVAALLVPISLRSVPTLVEDIEQTVGDRAGEKSPHALRVDP